LKLLECLGKSCWVIWFVVFKWGWRLLLRNRLLGVGQERNIHFGMAWNAFFLDLDIEAIVDFRRSYSLS